MTTGILGSMRSVGSSTKKVYFISEIKFPHETYQVFDSRKAEWCNIGLLAQLEEKILKPMNAKWSYHVEEHSVTVTREFNSFEDCLVWNKALYDSGALFKRPELLGYEFHRKVVQG